VLGATVWRAWPHAALRPTVKKMGLVLVLQALTGVATVYLNFPLTIAVLHNAGAALLVLFVTMLNYKAKHQLAVVAASSRHEPTPASLQQ
jgi:cytochrome c oxidase assembly protein subunit 15